MSKRDARTTLRQIAAHARHAQELCADKTLAELLADWKSVLALERALEILGEAVKPFPLSCARPTLPYRGGSLRACEIVSVMVTMKSTTRFFGTPSTKTCPICWRT